jgi:3-methylcrotonyl-CoA carboxylase alpha subunit
LLVNASPLDVPLPETPRSFPWPGIGGISEERGSTIIHEGGAAFVTSNWRVDATNFGVSGGGVILAPMPGKVIAVEIAAGDTVTKGQKLLVLEAMKMEHALTAPFDATVAELTVMMGAQVRVEALLVRVEKAE